ncbi:MAG: hypothetical protein H8K09_13025 [Nitrospira sp.]|nr:hypothetical protein [Nitrospira sp.]
MGQQTVTWNERRKGWVKRSGLPSAPAGPPQVAEPQPAPAVPSVIIIPPFPAFSPASIAELLKVYRSTVQYWMTAGKLECFRDNIGEPYVMRAELIRFVREYLKKGVQG